MASTLPATTPDAPSAFEAATYRKVSWRLAPLLLLCYVVAYLDRVNVGFAKLQMAADLHLSDAVPESSSSAIFCSKCRAT